MKRASRIAAVVASAAMVGSALVLGGQVAGAASFAGELRAHGPGGIYGSMGQTYTQAVASGGTATYAVEVFNHDTTPAQFRVRLNHTFADGAPTLLAGSTNITDAASTDGWYTNLIAPNTAQVLKLTVKMLTSVRQLEDDITLSLDSISGFQLGQDYVITYIKAPVKGATAADLFVHQGSLASVGGSTDSQIASGPVLKAGTKATFTATLQNDGNAPASIGLVYQRVPELADFPIVVKDGIVDVTTRMLDGNYATAVLAVGAKHNLTFTITYTGNDPSEIFVGLRSTFDGVGGPENVLEYLNINVAA